MAEGVSDIIVEGVSDVMVERIQEPFSSCLFIFLFPYFYAILYPPALIVMNGEKATLSSPLSSFAQKKRRTLDLLIQSIHDSYDKVFVIVCVYSCLLINA